MTVDTTVRGLTPLPLLLEIWEVTACATQRGVR
jgi:hypothetical protein